MQSKIKTLSNELNTHVGSAVRRLTNSETMLQRASDSYCLKSKVSCSKLVE